MANKNKRQTQKTRILQYIADFGSITRAEAMIDIAVGNFFARMTELKKDGYIFDKKMEKGKNRYGEDIFYYRYSNARKQNG